MTKVYTIELQMENLPLGLYFLEYLMENSSKGFTKVIKI